jgi:hypothetical protein
MTPGQLKLLPRREYERLRWFVIEANKPTDPATVSTMGGGPPDV